MENTDIGFLMKQIHETIKKDANEKFRAFGLTHAQSKVLGYLRRNVNRNVTQKEIEQYLGVSHPTTVGLIQRLEAKGFVSTSIDPDDKRSKFVAVTVEEEKIFLQMQELKERNESNMVKGLSEDEVKQLKSLLIKVLQNLN